MNSFMNMETGASGKARKTVFLIKEFSEIKIEFYRKFFSIIYRMVILVSLLDRIVQAKTIS